VQTVCVITEAEIEISTLDPTGPPDAVALQFATLARLHLEAANTALSLRPEILRLGRPGPVCDLVNTVLRDADAVAAGHIRAEAIYESGQRAALAGALLSREAAEMVLRQVELSRWLFARLASVNDFAAHASERARAYLDGAFARLTADPERNATEAELDRFADAEIAAGGGFRGSIDALIAAVDA
jgi:hypothetical protein